MDAAGPAAARGRLWKQKALPQPPTVRLGISDEAGDSHKALGKRSAFSTSAHRSYRGWSYASKSTKSKKRKQEQRQKQGSGLTPLNYVSTEDGEEQRSTLAAER